MGKISSIVLLALLGGMAQAGVMRWQVGAHGPEAAGPSFAMARVRVAEGRIDTGYDVWDGDGWSVPESLPGGGFAWFDSSGYGDTDPERMFVNELVDDCLDAFTQSPSAGGVRSDPRQDGPKIAVSNFYGVVPTSYIFWNGELSTVPEPSCGMLALLGGAVLSLRRRRP